MFLAPMDFGIVFLLIRRYPVEFIYYKGPKKLQYKNIVGSSPRDSLILITSKTR